MNTKKPNPGSGAWREQLRSTHLDAPPPSVQELDWTGIERRVFEELDRKGFRARPTGLLHDFLRVPDIIARPAAAWAAAAIAVALGVWTVYLTAAMPHARVVEISRLGGDAWVMRVGSGTWRPAGVRGRLTTGTRVRAGDFGPVDCTAGEALRLTLGAGAEITVRALLAQRTVFALSRGSLRVDVEPALLRGGLAVVTPNAVCEVKGTVFEVVVSTDSAGAPRTELAVERGAVRFSTGSSDSLSVGLRQRAIALGDSLFLAGPSEPLPVTPPPAPTLDFRVRPSVGTPATPVRVPGSAAASAETLLTDTSMVRPETPATDSGSAPRADSAAPAPRRGGARSRVDLLPEFAPDRQIRGSGRSIRGRVTPGILRLPTGGQGNAWAGTAIDDISAFVSNQSGLYVDPAWQTVSFDGKHKSFRQWLKDAARPRPITRHGVKESAPEESALEMLADAVSLLSEKDIDGSRRMLDDLISGFMKARFRKVVIPQNRDWARQAGVGANAPGWLRSSMLGAENACAAFRMSKKPSGTLLEPLYGFLRTMHIVGFPLLICRPSGEVDNLEEAQICLLRAYIESGGALYLSAGLDESWGARRILERVLDETTHDSIGDTVLRKLQRTDRMQTGFRFNAPRPAVFHPFCCLPMVLPKACEVTVTILNRNGAPVFIDSLAAGPGAYEDTYRCFRWYSQYSGGSSAPSGFYMYQVEAELAKQTFPIRVSALRRLTAGAHPIFQAYFTISDVPLLRSVEPIALPTNEPGVFGVRKGGRMAVCYSEGYGELNLIDNKETGGRGREAALRWMTNVIVYLLGETGGHQEGE